MARRRRWGQGNVIPPSTSGGTYAIRYHDKTGKRVFESGFTSEPLARQALEARRTDIARQRVGLPADSSRLPTLATLGDAWADRRAQTTRNGAKERANWRTHVRPALNNLHGQDVDVAWVRSYVEGKRATLSGATVRSHVRLLSMLLQDCAERPRETGVTVNTCALFNTGVTTDPCVMNTPTGDHSEILERDISPNTGAVLDDTTKPNKGVGMNSGAGVIDTSTVTPD